MPGLTYLSMHLDGQSQEFTIMLFVVAVIVTALLIGTMIYIIRDNRKH